MPAQNVDIATVRLSKSQKAVTSAADINQAAAIQAAIKNQQVEAAPAPEFLEGNFQDVREIFHGISEGVPTQQELEAKAINGTIQPVAPVTQSAPNQDPTKNIKVVPRQSPKPKAPSSARELQEQHQAPLFEGQRYPEIHEIFMGQIPGHEPANRQVMPVPAAPEQVVRTEIVITHELPSQALCYIALVTFDQWVDETFFHFEANQLITDQYVIDQLVTDGCNKIAPYENRADFITCPNCSHSFPDGRGAVKYR